MDNWFGYHVEDIQSREAWFPNEDDDLSWDFGSDLEVDSYPDDTGDKYEPLWEDQSSVDEESYFEDEVW